MVRASHCTRSRTQIIVGTSSTSMTTQVMTASSRVISIEAQQRRDALALVGGDLLPRPSLTRCRAWRPPARTAAIASSGSRKNSPKIVNTT